MGKRIAATICKKNYIWEPNCEFMAVHELREQCHKRLKKGRVPLTNYKSLFWPK